MRIVTLVLGILGALICAALATTWLSDASEMRALIDELRAAGVADQIDSIVRGSYALLASAVLGIAGGVLTMKHQGRLGAALFAIAVVLPVIFTAKALLGTFLFVAAAGCALKVGTKSKFARAA